MSILMYSPDRSKCERNVISDNGVCLLRTEIDTQDENREYVHNWYVIHCKARKEKSTSETLKAHLGLVVYLPEKKIWYKGNAVFLPFFPGYFFVQANLQEIALSQINTSPGVLRLLSSEGVPQMIPSYVVEKLHTEITRLNEGQAFPNQGFSPGDTLHVTDGPLRGLEGVFIGPTTPSKRVQVFLNFLGCLTKTDIDASALEKLPEDNNPRRIRYTRGKGRKLHEEKHAFPSLFV
jgi:transcriptional antiterminator RfaH